MLREKDEHKVLKIYKKNINKSFPKRNFNHIIALFNAPVELK